MDLYYVIDGVPSIATEDNLVAVAQNGDTVINGDGSTANQLLVVADSHSNAQILFNELFVRKVAGLAISPQSFGGFEFEGIHQSVLDDANIYPIGGE
jgi:hypothetical protein